MQTRDRPEPGPPQGRPGHGTFSSAVDSRVAAKLVSILAERSARPPPTDQLASARIAVATMASASSSDRLPCVILLRWLADCLLDDAGPTPTPIGRVPLDVIRYIASAFLSEASAATLSRSENSGVSELSEPEGGHPA